MTVNTSIVPYRKAIEGEIVTPAGQRFSIQLSVDSELFAKTTQGLKDAMESVYNCGRLSPSVRIVRQWEDIDKGAIDP